MGYHRLFRLRRNDDPSTSLTHRRRRIDERVRAMTELKDRIHTALGETRILILGSQILVGFQLTAVFEDAFDQFAEHARQLDGLALLLMLTALAALIAPGTYHRIVESGRDSEAFHRYISTMATVALLPFAISIGLDVFITIERIFGLAAGLAAGGSIGALALLLWYGVELFRNRPSRPERSMTVRRRDEAVATPLHARVEQMLSEARVILPGAQALLGFQLIIVTMRSFDALSASAKLVHAVSLVLIAIAVILLMAPAAYHRIVCEGEDSAEFHRIGSAMVTAATLPLALGIGGDVDVVMTQIFRSSCAGAGIAAVVTAGFVTLWHVVPLALRPRRSRHPG
jgi:uncharacterized protein DUF6328